MKCPAERLYPRGLCFSVPLDKGNEGSGNEIVNHVVSVVNLKGILPCEKQISSMFIDEKGFHSLSSCS